MKNIDGQLWEERGFRRVPGSGSVYWKIVGGPELCVLRTGQSGYKTCEFESEDIPEDETARNVWGDQWAVTIAGDRNFKWHRD